MAAGRSPLTLKPRSKRQQSIGCDKEARTRDIRGPTDDGRLVVQLLLRTIWERVEPIVGMEQGDRPKQMTACRQVLKDRVPCPDCGSIMTIRSLRYRHTCKSAGPSPEKLEHMRQKATRRPQQLMHVAWPVAG